MDFVFFCECRETAPQNTDCACECHEDKHAIHGGWA